MSVYHASEFVLPLPADHRFPMAKYRRLHDRLKQTYPDLALHRPPAALDRQLLRVHTPSYLNAIVTGEMTPSVIRRIGFPWSPELVERSRRSVGASVAAARSAVQTGRGVNLAGGTHHASSDAGAGYCVFNDIAVAARAMQTEGKANNIVVLDLDVHQGDGTARIFANDSTVKTISVHGARNYPFEKPRSDLDIALPDDTRDDGYLDAVENAIRFGLQQGPVDLVFYLAGADPYVEDKLGRLAVSEAGLAHRDTRVFEACDRLSLPVATVMGGGYAPDIDRIVDIHQTTVEIALGLRATTPTDRPSG